MDPTAEPEVSGEPEPEPEMEPTVEPEINIGLPETKPEMGFGPDPEPEPEHTATLAEVVVPSVGLIFLLLVGMVILMIAACWKRRRMDEMQRPWSRSSSFLRRRGRPNTLDNDLSNGSTYKFGDLEISNDHSDPFLSPIDVESMRSLKKHYNRPLSLLVINLPAVISLALCPCLLLLRKPLVTAFWPAGLPNINEGVGCFLAPAGLVYAITFGFTFQSVLDKQRTITSTVSAEIGLLEQILSMTSRMTSLRKGDKLRVYRLVKTEIVSIMQQVTGRREMGVKDYQDQYSAGQIWGVVNIMQENGRQLSNCDAILMDKLIGNLQELSTASTQRHMTLHYTVHPLLWAFLEMLGFFSFLGVMLIKTESTQMDLTMCMITVFSISLLCYVVADLDNPFAGYFRVNLDTLWYLVGKAEYFYRQEKTKSTELIMKTSTFLDEVSEVATAPSCDVLPGNSFSQT